MLTYYGISPDFHGGVHFFIPPNAIGSVPNLSGHAIVHRDGVHYRQSAGAGPVIFEVVSVTGAAFAGLTMDQLMCASIVSNPLLVCSEHVV